MNISNFHKFLITVEHKLMGVHEVHMLCQLLGWSAAIIIKQIIRPNCNHYFTMYLLCCIAVIFSAVIRL